MRSAVVASWRWPLAYLIVGLSASLAAFFAGSSFAPPVKHVTVVKRVYPRTLEQLLGPPTQTDVDGAAVNPALTGSVCKSWSTPAVTTVQCSK